MKRITGLAAVAGLILLAVLVAMSGADAVFGAVAEAGWATALVVAARFVAIVAVGVAWFLLFPVGNGLSVGVAILLRFVREGANQLLPVAAVGGDIIGARLATFWRVDGATAGASVVADVALQAATQLVYAVAGLLLLVWLAGDSELVHYAAAGLAVAGVGIGAFALLQHQGGSRLLSALARRVAGGRDWAGMATLSRFYERLGAIYGNRRRVAGSAAIHMATWVFGTVEVWVALHFMGYPISLAEAFVIEALGQAVRGAAFAVPGGLGVQEGGFIALCALFGIPAGPAVAVSLLKRVADVGLGIPGLLVWQGLEGRRAFASPLAPAADLADRSR